MRGPKILLLVLAAAGVMLWLALVGGRDSDLDRGLQETGDALARVQTELSALDPSYQALRAQGLVLGLREQHDRITTLLSQHEDRRVQIRTDSSLDPRQRLPLLHTLVDQIDETLALAVKLHRTVDALVEFKQQVTPLLAQARELRDKLAAATPPDDAWTARRSALASTLSEQEQQIPLADRLMRDNTEQGTALGARVVASLRTLIDDQHALLAKAGD
jgi:hypothetical protein